MCPGRATAGVGSLGPRRRSTVSPCRERHVVVHSGRLGGLSRYGVGCPDGPRRATSDAGCQPCSGGPRHKNPGVAPCLATYGCVHGPTSVIGVGQLCNGVAPGEQPVPTPWHIPPLVAARDVRQVHIWWTPTKRIVRHGIQDAPGFSAYLDRSGVSNVSAPQRLNLPKPC